jgi:hypothetical protein
MHVSERGLRKIKNYYRNYFKESKAKPESINKSNM